MKHDLIIVSAFFMIFYILAATLFYAFVNNVVEDNCIIFRKSARNFFYMETEKISIILSIIWPISLCFMFGCSLGSEIYSKLIIKNEEDRIAAWLV